MNPYKAKRSVSAGSVFYIVLFFIVLAGLGYLFYYDKGLFWDYLPLVCIPMLLIAIGIIIFYFAKRAPIGYTFILFFLIFLTGIILSAFFGPFALAREARESYEEQDYRSSIEKYQLIYEKYPKSRYFDESVIQLAYSSYLVEDYSTALDRFSDAAALGFISEQDLEIIKIYTDCYVELGEEAFESGKYDLSENFFLKASEYYDKILEDYPESNEAFRANYKSPEYRVKAAESLFNIQDYDGAIAILDNTISEFPDSDFNEKILKLQFETYIEETKSLISEARFEEALSTFLRILELDEEFISLNDYRFVRANSLVFEKVPIYISRETGYDLYNSEEYRKALFVFEGITQNNASLFDQFVPYIIASKVNLLGEDEFTQMQDTVPVGSINLKDRSIISFENQTEYTLKIYMRGSEYNIFDVSPMSREEIEVTSGYYQLLAELINTDILPFFGKFTFESGAKYREVFSLEQ